MMKIGFPISRKQNERRRALLPRHVRSVAQPGSLVFETGYGMHLGCTDEAYVSAGAVVAERRTVCDCPIICNAKPMLSDEYFAPGRILFGWLHAVQSRAMTDRLVQNQMTAIAWEDMSENGRHCFWRNNMISGEAAIAHAFLTWGRLPYECNVAVVGRGNVALGAIRALERAGCLVMVYNRVTSHLLRDELNRYDVIVNAVLWDLTRKDHLVSEQDLDRMKPGSLIVDISCDEHMGIESSRPTSIDDPVYWHKGILHYVVDHTPALFFRSATDCISEVVARFVDALVEERSDPVLQQATIIRGGDILDRRIIQFQHR